MSTNSSMKKTSVHNMEVLHINGEDLFLDNEGNVVRRERRDKKRLFSDANKKIKDEMSKEEMELAQLLAAQKRQNS